MLKPFLTLFAFLAASRAGWASQAQQPPQPPPLPSGQQQPEPPARYDRPRPTHRPPREDTFFNLGPVLFKGVELQGGWMGGDGLNFNMRDKVIAEPIGGGVAIETSRLRYDEKINIESTVIGGTVDLNLLRLSLEGMEGHWEGGGTLTVDNGVSTLLNAHLPLHGDFWGFQGSAYWPSFRLRTGPFEATLGPEFRIAWFYEGVHSIQQSPFRMTDKLDSMVGGIAPRLSLRYIADHWDVSLNAEYVYIFGGTQGWMTEGTIGIGYRF